MRILIYVTAHYHGSQENPLFLRFTRWLASSGIKCMLSVPESLDPGNISGTKTLVRKTKADKWNPSLYQLLKKKIFDKSVHSFAPIVSWKEILWKADKVFVFSDPFIDSSFYKGTWLFNVLKARNTPVIKICNQQTIYDKNLNHSLIQKHINTLEIFTSIFLSNEQVKLCAERNIAYRIKGHFLPNLENWIIKPTGNDMSGIALYCPLPCTHGFYLQDLLIQCWDEVFGTSKQHLLILNNWGRDVEKTKLHCNETGINVNWVNKDDEKAISFSSMFMISRLVGVDGGIQFSNFDEVPIITNLATIQSHSKKGSLVDVEESEVKSALIKLSKSKLKSFHIRQEDVASSFFKKLIKK